VGLNQSDRKGQHPDPERLGAWHDGELGAVEAMAVREHVESCPSCRAAVDEMARIDVAAMALQPEDPGTTFWTELESRIMSEVRSGERGKGTSAVLEPEAAPELLEAGRRTSWWDILTGRGRTLPWAVATAAGLVVILLSSRLIMNQFYPAGSVLERSTDRETAYQGAPRELSAESPAPEPRQQEMQSEQALRAPVRINSDAGRAAPDAPSAEGYASGEALSREEPAAGPPVADDLRDDGKAMADADDAVPAPSEADGSTTAFKMSEEPKAAILMKTEELEARAKDVIAGAADAVGRPSESTARTGSTFEAPTLQAMAPPNEALAYAAEVEGVLRSRENRITISSPDRKAPGRGDAGVAEPGTLDEQVADAARRRALHKPRSEDYEIAYAAAFRALESGELDLARRGFRLVALGIPESGLARDAEFNDRLVQFRVLERQGVDPDMILIQASERAEQAWDRAQEIRSTATCREALALERVRVVLLGEIRPGGDTAAYEERISRLRACS
jgi:TolA-binding protein